MLHDQDWYIDEVAALVDRDAGLRAQQAAYDRIAHLEYSLPEPLARLQWMRNYRTTAPYDALRGATRALSGIEEAVTIEPVSVSRALEKGYDSDTTQARVIANQWETVLKWNMRRASQRHAIFRSDIVRSAVMYDEICAQVVHLPTQIKAHSKLGGSTNRYKAALRHGPFAVLLRNPQTVHTRYSDYMAEAVVSITCQTPQGIVDIWGDAARGVSRLIEDEKAEDEYLLVDYTDLDGRCVWVVPGNDEGQIGQYGADSDSFIEIVPPTELDYPFLPWVCVVGGTGLDSSPEHKRLPLLYPIYQSELWLNANMVGSLGASMAVATAAQPRIKRSGPDPNSVNIDYETPGGTIDVTPGHDAEKMQVDGMDPAMAALWERHLSEIDRTTVSKILVTAEAGVGETFSGYNLRVNTAKGSLIPYKTLAERGLEGIYNLFLLWSEATGEDISGYGAGREDKGKKYSIGSGDIDPEGTYLTVELQFDLPVDRQQRINGAAMMKRELKVSDRYALEELGVTDPEAELAQWAQDQLRGAVLAGKVQMIQMEQSGQLQQLIEQGIQQRMQMQAEQAQQIGQVGADPNQMGGFGQMANPQDFTGGSGLGPLAGGPGNNPAMGGNPAAMNNPGGATREMQTGMDALGGAIGGM